mgnify:CR=1 FL=1
MIKYSGFIFSLQVLILTGCSTFQFQDNEPDFDSSEPVNLSAEAQEVLSKEIEAANEELLLDDQRLKEDQSSKLKEELLKIEKKEPVEEKVAEKELASIPVEVNSAVKRWIHYFTKKDKERFNRFLKRGNRYRQVVQDILDQHEVPRDLYYLAMIESGYVNSAVSHAGAVGPWQFIRSTGKSYGLDQSYYVDERNDPIQATDAAARHLRDLHERFGSWYLAMAAYNAGAARVSRAVKRGRSKNFWRLVRKRVLPRETRNYVPKFLAALIIGRNPEKFGFTDTQSEKYPDIEAVEVPSPIYLKDVARVAGVPAEDLYKVNPHIKRKVTPPENKKFEIWVPVKYSEKIKSSFDKFSKNTAKGIKSSRYYASLERQKRRYHRVRRGETLSHIARKYRLSVGALKRLNGLRTSRIYAGKKLRVSSGGAARAYASNKTNRKYHTVRTGETLSHIARRYRLSVNYLKKINGLSSSRIYAGKSLRVSTKNYKSSKLTRYKVRRGDSLYSIARRFGTSISALKRINNIRKDRIYIGQFLNVRI